MGAASLRLCSKCAFWKCGNAARRLQKPGDRFVRACGIDSLLAPGIARAPDKQGGEVRRWRLEDRINSPIFQASSGDRESHRAMPTLKRMRDALSVFGIAF